MRGEARKTLGKGAVDWDIMSIKIILQHNSGVTQICSTVSSQLVYMSEQVTVWSHCTPCTGLLCVKTHFCFSVWLCSLLW